MQPTEPHEDANAERVRERARVRPVDPEVERVQARRAAQEVVAEPPPDADWLRSNWPVVLVLAVVLAIVVVAVYVWLT